MDRKIRNALFLLAFALAIGQFANAQWVQQNPNTINWLEDIYCTSVDTCYAVGQNETIIKTTDGGTNWNVIYTGGGV